MADFQPFVGLRYNCKKINLADVLAPPYDVIKGGMREKLAGRSPYNVVGVELPEGEGDAKYEAAARLLEQWQNEGILISDDPCFYIYEQEFAVPGAESGTTKKRRGVLGALWLEEFGQGVQPHEHTLSGPKEDRLKLLRATHTNTSPIFGLYEDNNGWVDSVLEVICNTTPLCEARDDEGVAHRMWKLDDDESVNAIVAALEKESVLIADGHHRYETALNYRHERRAQAEAAGGKWTGEEPYSRVLMMCVSMQDEGLVVLPTHRLVKQIPEEKLNGLIDALNEPFLVEVLPNLGESKAQAKALLERINQDSGIIRIGLHLRHRSYSLSLRQEGDYRSVLDQQRSEAYNSLDVTVLHTLILEKLLGIGPAELAAGGHVAYTIDAAEAIAKVEAGDYSAAFMLRPTKVQQVKDVAAAGDKMPQKSTYFYPKLVTGMVLRPVH